MQTDEVAKTPLLPTTPPITPSSSISELNGKANEEATEDVPQNGQANGTQDQVHEPGLFAPVPRHLVNIERLKRLGDGVTAADLSQGDDNVIAGDGLIKIMPLETSGPFAGLGATMTGPGSTSKQQSFNFLGLSVDIRCCIYQLLVLVPGLICARQKKTPLVPFFNQAPLHDTKVQHQDLLPGIAYALCHLVSTASKTRFSKLPYTNICILRSCKQVHEEASAVLYGLNIFDLFNHTKETMPKADFKIPLFPHIYQCQIRRLAIKSGGLYMFRFVLLGGWQSLQAAYPALESLTLILEFESSTQGCAIRWARKSGEEWCGYVARVRDELALEIYGCLGLVKTIPDWIGLRMAFNDEKYVDVIDPGLGEFQHDVLDETNRRIVLRRGVVEAFERFRKGSGKR